MGLTTDVTSWDNRGLELASGGGGVWGGVVGKVREGGEKGSPAPDIDPEVRRKWVRPERRRF